jgi:hypothetical protein
MTFLFKLHGSRGIRIDPAVHFVVHGEDGGQDLARPDPIHQPRPHPQHRTGLEGQFFHADAIRRASVRQSNQRNRQDQPEIPPWDRLPNRRYRLTLWSS